MAPGNGGIRGVLARRHDSLLREQLIAYKDGALSNEFPQPLGGKSGMSTTCLCRSLRLHRWPLVGSRSCVTVSGFAAETSDTSTAHSVPTAIGVPAIAVAPRAGGPGQNPWSSVVL